MLLGDTIAAIATAPGRGGVAIVRVSGSAAHEVAKRLTGRDAAVGRVTFARFFESVGTERVAIDDGIVLAFAAPHSYTGEDVVEFQCHGGSVVPRRILKAAIAAGARLARRGEFTQRAYLNGKLDYEQAEAVLDLIDAKTERAADSAYAGLEGRKRRECRALYDSALAISTELEHAIDVDEEDFPEGFVVGLVTKIAAFRDAVSSALRRANEGRLLRDGALVVLAGPPNSGKSSLMNALLGECRAIVSDIPGTTRDSIEEWLDIEGWPVRLADTAGLRETSDAIESEGVRRAEALMSQAAVIISLSPQSHLSSLISPIIPVHSKCDLGRGEGLNVSAKTGEGLDELKHAIASALEAKAAKSDEEVASSVETAALVEVLAMLDENAADWQTSPDIVLMANLMRGASEKLGTLIGATYSADLLDQLFSRFCVGK